jgi:hypothetical protein
MKNLLVFLSLAFGSIILAYHKALDIDDKVEGI